MLTVTARNANQALPEMMLHLQMTDIVTKQGSRNGEVMRFNTPVAIRYKNPTERVVFWPERDANPFFHLFEALWMLAGRNDVAYVQQFSSQIGNYSDDGRTFHGAYGYRWRHFFSFDQLKVVAETLIKNPLDRRCVIQMWDAAVDMGREGKDFPCNLMAIPQIAPDGRLNLTVFNRSNDVVWGALGANCVHFSMLQEFLAAWIKVPVGEYWQVSTNMHGYVWNTEKCLTLSDKAFPSRQYESQDPYAQGRTHPYPLMSKDVGTWQEDLTMFLSEGHHAIGYRDPFFRRVASPLHRAYEFFSNRQDPDRFQKAMNAVATAAPCDWKLACEEWLLRRSAAAKAKAQAAVA